MSQICFLKISCETQIESHKISPSRVEPREKLALYEIYKKVFCRLAELGLRLLGLGLEN